MRLFLDTANLDHIKYGVRIGVISGVTTNPSLVSKEGKVDYKQLVQQICEVVPGPVSTEVLSMDAEGMVSEACKIARWADNVVVKIPATLDGMEATRQLSRENIKVNITLCFTVNQALMAAAAGAAFVSPFVGRLDDIGEDGIALVKDMVEVFSRYPQIGTQIIAASMRHTQHCLLAARAGAHIATIPYAVMLQMIQHPLTDIGVKRFQDDWKKVMGESKISQ